MRILIDQREKRPLWTKSTIDCQIEKTYLKTGDYSLVGHEDSFSIERKSISDLFGTLGMGHRRFKKEIERGLKLKYFAIVIDGGYGKILSNSFPGSKFTTMKGHVITSILFTIHIKYKIPIFFAKDRDQSRQIILELMEAYLKCNTV